MKLDSQSYFNTVGDCPEVIHNFGLENQFEEGKWEAYRSSFRCNPFVLINNDTVMLDTLNYRILISLRSIDKFETVIGVSYYDINDNRVRFKNARYVSEFAIGVEYNEVMYYKLAYGFTKFNSIDYLRTTKHHSAVAEEVYKHHTESEDTLFINFILTHKPNIDNWLYLTSKKTNNVLKTN